MIYSFTRTFASTDIHPDMSTFVGAVLAVLLCATFWDEPKKVMISWQGKSGKKYIEISRQKLLAIQATTSSLAEQLEDIEDDFEENSKQMKSFINWCYSTLYTPSAIICALLALAELYCGKVQDIGYWNAFLLIPFALFLIPSLLCIAGMYLLFCVKRLSFESRLNKITKKTANRQNSIMEYIEEQHK